MNVGILGAGGIAGKMADTIAEMSEAKNYAVASRSIRKAEIFADRHGVGRAYGSYEEMLSDPDVDLVYIALPHSHHYEWTIKTLSAGKNVLCEKAFAVNEAQAKEMIDTARAKGLLLAEAIWTRYMPSRKIIEEIVTSGVIGEIKTISANLGYRIDHVDRLTNPALAGGSLLDLTVYPLNFVSMIWGDEIQEINANCVYTETGVDGIDNVMLKYPGGRAANLFTTIYARTDRRGTLYGDKGYIEVLNINNPEKISVFDTETGDALLLKEYDVPKQISGYEYEVLACKRAIENGQTECEEMPHSEILKMMHLMDDIRKSFGIVYPEEK